ncbi:DEAD/DEAH box helicase [Candidatus Woesearchaeota archaeon]|nr:DEAD/DEAH box helicase [Candidatus Woesearchaeota archaeon]
MIKEQHFTQPTEIQLKTIPLVVEGKDVMGGSATGSGKTLAFGAGIIQNSESGHGMQALVLAPTRELAEQISEALKIFSRWKKLKVGVIYGGVSYGPQEQALAKCDIIVGTPGRILDHMERGNINFSKLKHLVLDEADRMLDMGFIDDVKKIMGQCPKEKQTLLFSATLHPEITSLAKKFMHDPVKISAIEHVDPKKLTQVYYEVAGPLKFSLLVHLLKKERTSGLIMIFCNSRRMVDVVEKNLKKQGISAMAIHGGLTQNRRSGVLDSFHGEKADVLVCTDVAARGLDIPQVTHVYNYDIPADGKSYVHRIGRTARAGKEGRVVNLLSQRDHPNFSRVLYENDFEVTKLEKPFIDQVKTDMTRSDRKPEHRGPRQYDRGDSRARERPERRSYGQRESRDESPRRRFGSDSGNDRPRGNFGSRSREGGSDRSRSSFGDKPRSSFGNRSREGGSDRPRSNFGDKPRSSFGSSAPKKQFSSHKPREGSEGSSSRPRGNKFGGRDGPREGNRGSSRFRTNDKPKTSFNNRGGARGAGKSRQRTTQR